MKKAFLASALLLATATTFASTNKVDAEWIVSSIETTETSLSADTAGTKGGGYYSPYNKGGDVAGTGSGEEDTPAKPTFEDRAEKVGTVIGIAKDLVALGEQIYELVQKGKPTNTTEYAPISVVPRDPMTKEYVDPFELENFSMPIEKKYTTVVKNGSGSEVVRFEYMIIFSYGGSYNGAGKYITGAEIVPIKVNTKFGWDFNATMKLGGIMNNGTKENPVAGVNLTMKYQMNSWSSSFERNDVIYINGAGQIKSYSR